MAKPIRGAGIRQPKRNAVNPDWKLIDGEAREEESARFVMPSRADRWGQLPGDMVKVGVETKTVTPGQRFNGERFWCEIISFAPYPECNPARIRVLAISLKEKVDIKRLVEYAESHRLDIHTVFKMAGGRMRPPGDTPEFVVHIPFGFRCCFTIEQQQIGWMRHLSVSINAPGKWPNEHAVAVLAEEFGFRHQLKDGKWKCYTEDHVGAVNIMELLED